MRYITLLVCLLISLAGFTQNFSKPEVTEDLNFLKLNIQKYQPTIAIYNADFTRKADSLIDQLPESMDRFQYFQHLSSMIALAGEGHYAVGDWNDTIHRGFGTNTYRYLPLNVWIIDGKLLVVEDLSRSGLQTGDVILSINGDDASDVCQQLSALIPCDGDIETYASHQLQERFNWFYYLAHSQPDKYEIKLNRGDSVWTQTLPALNRAEMIENVKLIREERGIEEKPTDPGILEFYELSTDSNLAVLKLKSFSQSLIEKYDLKAAKFYKEVFAEIEASGARNLVIDLRGNSGGRIEFEAEILPYIATEMPDEYYRKSVSWEGKERTYRLKKLNKDAYKGRVFVFTDGNTFSAGSTLARYLREYANATIIGEETGSRYEGYAAGSKQSVVLPNSGVRIGIPRYAILYAQSERQTTANRGVLPDIKIAADLPYLLGEEDPWMDILENLLRREIPQKMD